MSNNRASKLPSAPSPAEETAAKCKCGHGRDGEFGHDVSGAGNCGGDHGTCPCTKYAPALPEPVSTEGAAGLLPCPFCGAGPRTRPTGEEGEMLYIYCPNPDCEIASVEYETQRAIAAWNHRVAAPIAPAAVSGTLDVERAATWLLSIHGWVAPRWLAELLHDYSLTVARPSAEGDGWIAEPNEQGWWWHIDAGEHTDMIPYMYGILLSGTNGKMFVQYPDFRWCSDIGGLWSKATPPALPAPPSGQGEKR